MDPNSHHLKRVRTSLGALALAAEDHRRAVVAAWTAGATVRQLADACGRSSSAMHREIQAITDWLPETLEHGNVDRNGDLH